MSMGGIMGDSMKNSCIEEGYIPSKDCKLDGMRIFGFINENKNPCEECNMECSYAQKSNEGED